MYLCILVTNICIILHRNLYVGRLEKKKKRNSMNEHTPSHSLLDIKKKEEKKGKRERVCVCLCLKARKKRGECKLGHECPRICVKEGREW